MKGALKDSAGLGAIANCCAAEAKGGKGMRKEPADPARGEGGRGQVISLAEA